MIRLLKDAEIFSSVGEKIGMLDRVVLDPETKKISHIIAKQGILFPNRKVIPISYLNLDGERITLTKNAMELKNLPDFIESSYVSTEDADDDMQNTDIVYFYPPPYTAWWAAGVHITYPKSSYVVKEETIPEGTVALEEGATVLDRDGEKLGSVERVIVDQDEDRVTHLVVSRGLLSKEHKLIPTLWITDVMEDEVHLSINSNLFERLPEHELETYTVKNP